MFIGFTWVMGEQQISARAAYNELDLVIFFRDPISAKSDEPDIHSLLRECDINNIPFATNLGTAEMLIKGLERGDDLMLRSRNMISYTANVFTPLLGASILYLLATIPGSQLSAYLERRFKF